MGQQRNWLQATVERNKDNTLQIKWENNIEEVRIYWSTSPEHIEETGELLATVNGNYHIQLKTRVKMNVHILD